MLILTRYLNQGDRSVICIGEDIQITLINVENDQVKLALDLPDTLKVSLHSPLPRPLPQSSRPMRPATAKG